FFVFQAEDGIRFFHVTGVQTCALPISEFSGGEENFRPANLEKLMVKQVLFANSGTLRRRDKKSRHSLMAGFRSYRQECFKKGAKIGRASCREKMKIYVHAEAKKKKDDE